MLKMKLDNKVIEALKPAIRSTWNYISADCGDCSNGEAMELTIDAGRMSMQGFKKEDSLIHELVIEHTYTKVYKFLTKNIRLAYTSK